MSIKVGENFDGKLKVDQVWVKGKRTRTIVAFDETYMYYKTGTNPKRGILTRVYRSSFREWLHSGAELKYDPVTK